MDRNYKNRLKKIGVTREFQPKAKRNFFYFISHQVKIYLQRFAAYDTKMLYRNVLCMQLQVCIKNMLHFINKRSKMFDFKTFENMKLLCITVTKDLWSKKTTRYSYKRCNDLEKYRNLGRKIVDKFTKLSKGFSMKCFTADILRFFTENRQNMAFEWSAEYPPSNPCIPGIFLKFPNLIRSYLLKSFLSYLGKKARPTVKMPWAYLFSKIIK